jgi:hypothetical protein
MEFSKATYTAKDTDGTAPIAVRGLGGATFSKAVHKALNRSDNCRRFGAEISAPPSYYSVTACASTQVLATKPRIVHELTPP